MNNKNIIVAKTLENYEKKYKNRNYRLLKYTKKEVEEFDRLNKSNIKNFLLGDRKWVLVGDTYYEIPKAPRLSWFRNLNAGVQAGICLLGGGIVATAVTVPTVLINVNKGGQVTPTPIPSKDREIVIDDECKDAVEYKDMKITDNGLECVITKKSEDITLQDGIVVKIGDVELTGNADFEYDYETGNLLIYKSTLDDYKGKIVVSPLFSEKVDEVVVATTIKDNNEQLQMHAAKHEQYSLSDYTVTSSSGNTMSAIAVNNYKDEDGEYKTDLTIRDEVSGTETTVQTVGGIAGAGFDKFYNELVDKYDEENVSTSLIGGCGTGCGSALTAYDGETGDVVEQYLFDGEGLYGMQNENTNYCLFTFCVDYNSERVAIKDIGEYKDIFVKDETFETKSTGIAVKQSEELKTSSGEMISIPEKVLIENKEVSIDIISDFSNLNNINTIILPSTIKTIYNRAFENSSSLSCVIFENNSTLEEIMANAFFGTNLYTIVIPHNVKDITQGAFNGCSNLQTVYFEKTTGWKTKEDNKDVDVEDPYVNATQLKNVTVKSSWCFKGLMNEKAYAIDLGYDYSRSCFIKDGLQNVIQAGKTYNIVADYNGLTETTYITKCVFYENTMEENPIQLSKIIDVNDIKCTHYKTDGTPETLTPSIGGGNEDELTFNEDPGAGPVQYSDGTIVLTVRTNIDLDPNKVKSVIFSN